VLNSISCGPNSIPWSLFFWVDEGEPIELVEGHHHGHMEIAGAELLL
jgi:hypothetical protein